MHQNVAFGCSAEESEKLSKCCFVVGRDCIVERLEVAGCISLPLTRIVQQSHLQHLQARGSAPDIDRSEAFSSRVLARPPSSGINTKNLEPRSSPLACPLPCSRVRPSSPPIPTTIKRSRSSSGNPSPKENFIIEGPPITSAPIGATAATATTSRHSRHHHPQQQDL